MVMRLKRESMPRTRTITSCQEPDHCITLRHQHHSVIYASRPESDKVTELLLPHQHPVIHYYEPDALPDVQPTVTHTHTCLMALCPGLRWWAGTGNIKPIWILLKQETEWQWHQLVRMQVCTSLQTDNYTSTPPLSFLQAGCTSCHPTNSVKALKANQSTEGKQQWHVIINFIIKTKTTAYHLLLCLFLLSSVTDVMSIIRRQQRFFSAVLLVSAKSALCCLTVKCLVLLTCLAQCLMD